MRQERCPYCGALQLDGRCPNGHAPPTGIPPYSEPTTSRDAAIAMIPVIPEQEAKVYGAIGGGRTCDGLEVVTGLSHQSVSARLNGLEKRGLVRKGPRKAPTRSGHMAWVYEVT